MHAEAQALATRLVKGQAWITEAYDRLLALPGNGTREEFDRWYSEFDRWDRMARELMAYRGYVDECIHGGKWSVEARNGVCPALAVANCRGCTP